MLNNHYRVFPKSYCWSGILLCHDNVKNTFTDDWATFLYHVCSMCCYNFSSKSEYCKVLETVTSDDK